MNSVLHPTTGHAMEYREMISNPDTKRDWELSSANEFGRFFQGVGDRIKGKNTCFLIKKTLSSSYNDTSSSTSNQNNPGVPSKLLKKKTPT